MFALAAAVAMVGSSISQFLQECNLFALLVRIPSNPCDLQPAEGSSSYSFIPGVLESWSPSRDLENMFARLGNLQSEKPLVHIAT